MWLERVVYAPLFFLLLSCSDRITEMQEPEISGGEMQSTPVTFRAGTATNVSLFIFRKTGDRFLYQSEIDKGWSMDGKITVSMEKGDYQFLFVCSNETGMTLTPDSPQTDTSLEEIRFNALPDPIHEGEILPVNELFLPDPEVATQVYAIQGGETVSCTLKRAVSRLLLVLKRGHAENGVYVPEPYPTGSHILQEIQEAQVTISGIGTSADIYGTKGTGTLSTTFSEADKDDISDEGFASFTGPFFFPPTDNGTVRVSVDLIPQDGTTGETIRKVVTGQVKKNEQLQVVLWVEAGDEPHGERIIGVTVDTQPISEETDGDKGIWE